mmetsp:Transcript_26802/g.34324  ORF Transcript_26802/g.34324 Transcript_26802/m.34324 type:complete len:201 (+) Transcript_26802:248-850(+)
MTLEDLADLAFFSALPPESPEVFLSALASKSTLALPDLASSVDSSSSASDCLTALAIGFLGTFCTLVLTVLLLLDFALPCLEDFPALPSIGMDMSGGASVGSAGVSVVSAAMVVSGACVVVVAGGSVVVAGGSVVVAGATVVVAGTSVVLAGASVVEAVASVAAIFLAEQKSPDAGCRLSTVNQPILSPTAKGSASHALV